MPEKSTTPDMLATTRRSNEAIIRRDFDAVIAIFWPDAALDTSPVGMGVFQGREAIRGFYEDWFGSYEDFGQVIGEARDLGSDVGRAVYLQRGRPAGSARFDELTNRRDSPVDAETAGRRVVHDIWSGVAQHRVEVAAIHGLDGCSNQLLQVG